MPNLDRITPTFRVVLKCVEPSLSLKNIFVRSFQLDLMSFDWFRTTNTLNAWLRNVINDIDGSTFKQSTYDEAYKLLREFVGTELEEAASALARAMDGLPPPSEDDIGGYGYTLMPDVSEELVPREMPVFVVEEVSKLLGSSGEELTVQYMPKDLVE